MPARKKNKYSIGSICRTLSVVLVLFYLSYHAASGERGLFAYLQLTKKIEARQGELDEIKAEKFYLQHRVSLLRDESLDVDMLDEQARNLLGYAAEGEQIYKF